MIIVDNKCFKWWASVWPIYVSCWRLLNFYALPWNWPVYKVYNTKVAPLCGTWLFNQGPQLQKVVFCHNLTDNDISSSMNWNESRKREEVGIFWTSISNLKHTFPLMSGNQHAFSISYQIMNLFLISKIKLWFS